MKLISVDCVNRTAPLAEHVTEFQMIRTTNVKSGKLLLSEVRYVEEDIFHERNRRATPQVGDIILTREAPVGEVGVLDAPGKFFLGQRLMLYRPDATKMTSEYMLYSFRSKFLLEQFRQGSSRLYREAFATSCLPRIRISGSANSDSARIFRSCNIGKKHLGRDRGYDFAIR